VERGQRGFGAPPSKATLVPPPPGQNIVENRMGRRSAPTTVSSSVRTREYLTTAEIECLMAAARKSSRYGHRDATMILIGYRHGLRASELCDLQCGLLPSITASRNENDLGPGMVCSLR